MSWSSELISSLTLKQAELLYQYWQASQDGCYLSFECRGHQWVDFEWQGQDADGAPTHCHITTGNPMYVDTVLTKYQIDVCMIELRSGINRAFDKPDQSPFRET
jgi:hypothetical protein